MIKKIDAVYVCSRCGAFSAKKYCDDCRALKKGLRKRKEEKCAYADCKEKVISGKYCKIHRALLKLNGYKSTPLKAKRTRNYLSV